MTSPNETANLTERDTVKNLKHVGRRLLRYLHSVDKILEQLDKLELLLSTVDQCPTKPIQESLVPSMKALISNELLRHADDDVKISVISCIIEITRITAPDAPYDDEEMMEIFKLTVTAFEMLSHVSGRGYEKTLNILDNVSKIKLCLLMLDLECDDLVVEMFQHFLRNIRSNHPQNAVDSMESIMTTVLEESEEISSDLLRPLLDSVKKENQTISPISFTLGEKVITNCAVELKPYLIRAVESSGRALDEYAQIVTCICQNDSESPQSDHSNGSNKTVVQAVENNPDDVPKDVDEQACEVTKGLELDTTSAKGAQIMDDVMSNIRSASASTVDGEAIQKSGSKRKSHSDLTKHPKRRKDKTNSKADNLKCGLELKSETQLNVVPKKRDRRPNSLMNAVEGYDPSWIYKGTRAEKSALSSKARDSSSACPSSDKPTSRKDRLHLQPKTVSGTSVSESKDKDIEKPVHSSRTSDAGTDFAPCENQACSKDSSLLSTGDKKKGCETLVSKPKTDDSVDAAPPPSKSSIRDESHPKRGRQKKISSSRNKDALPNFVPMLKEGNLNPLPEETTLESPGVRLEKESEVRKDSEMKPGTPIRKIKLKLDGITLVAPKLADTNMETKVSGEDEGKHESPANIEVEKREEGRSSAQTQVKKRRRQNATDNEGLNKSSAVKELITKSASKTLSGVEETPQARMSGRKVTMSAEASETHDLGNSLVGRRIKVWWPMDKMFYEGVIHSYDPSERKHQILYDDGDKEVLNLKEERWELVAGNVSPKGEEGDALQKLAEASDLAEKIKEISELELPKGGNTSSRSRGRASAKTSKSESARSAVKSTDTSAADRSNLADESVDDPPKTVGRQDSAGKPKTKRKKTGSDIKKNKPETDKHEKKKATEGNA